MATGWMVFAKVIFCTTRISTCREVETLSPRRLHPAQPPRRRPQNTRQTRTGGTPGYQTDSVDSVAVESYRTSINHSVEFRAVFDHHEAKVYVWSLRPCRDAPFSRAIR